MVPSLLSFSVARILTLIGQTLPFLGGFMVVRPYPTRGYAVQYLLQFCFFIVVILTVHFAFFLGKRYSLNQSQKEWIKRLNIIGAGALVLLSVSFFAYRVPSSPTAKGLLFIYITTFALTMGLASRISPRVLRLIPFIRTLVLLLLSSITLLGEFEPHLMSTLVLCGPAIAPLFFQTPLNQELTSEQTRRFALASITSGPVLMVLCSSVGLLPSSAQLASLLVPIPIIVDFIIRQHRAPVSLLAPVAGTIGMLMIVFTLL